MRFKIRNTQIYFSFTFLALIILSLNHKNRYVIISAIVTALMHEAVHVLFILLYKCKVKQVNITLLGGNIIRDTNNKTTYLREAMINLSAPLFNIALGLFLLSIKPCLLFGKINLIIGLFNIIPFYNFDGGNALLNILLCFFNERKSLNVITSISFLIILIIGAFTFKLSLIYGYNSSLAFINIYLFVILFSNIFKK